jgi:hypothetical protein
VNVTTITMVYLIGPEKLENLIEVDINVKAQFVNAKVLAKALFSMSDWYLELRVMNAVADY